MKKKKKKRKAFSAALILKTVGCHLTYQHDCAFIQVVDKRTDV